jgi:6-pyruvoyltetrahydropterin/6-carboxytetrahydropterin synthase
MYRTITVEAGFCYGHRLHEYVGKCAHLHGHQGTVQVTFGCDRLDPQGMVMDFGLVKGFVRDWVDRNWDHRMMLFDRDPMVQAVLPLDDKVHPVAYNPTAENLAAHLVEAIRDWLRGLDAARNPAGAKLLSVRFWETPTSSVTCYADGARSAEGTPCGSSE